MLANLTFTIPQLTGKIEGWEYIIFFPKKKKKIDTATLMKKLDSVVYLTKPSILILQVNMRIKQFIRARHRDCLKQLRDSALITNLH